MEIFNIKNIREYKVDESYFYKNRYKKGEAYEKTIPMLEQK